MPVSKGHWMGQRGIPTQRPLPSFPFSKCTPDTPTQSTHQALEPSHIGEKPPIFSSSWACIWNPTAATLNCRHRQAGRSRGASQEWGGQKVLSASNGPRTCLPAMAWWPLVFLVLLTQRVRGFLCCGLCPRGAATVSPSALTCMRPSRVPLAHCATSHQKLEAARKGSPRASERTWPCGHPDFRPLALRRDTVVLAAELE